MNQRPIDSRTITNLGYRHTRMNLADYKPTTHWVVIKEELERDIKLDSGGMIHVPDAKNVTIGTIMALSDEAEAEGMKVGDRVIYEQWQGGRWAFTVDDPDRIFYTAEEGFSKAHYRTEELECLIMSQDSVWCIMR